MKGEIYKNPILYYILVPAISAIWPLLVWGVYLPEANRRVDTDISKFKQAQETAEIILNLDRDRLELSDAKTGSGEFDYVSEVYRIATMCGIPQSNCKIRTGLIIKKTGGQKSQTANVTLENVDITRLAEFLSKIELRWSNLQCTEVKLTKKAGVRDKWDAKLKFNYYY